MGIFVEILEYMKVAHKNNNAEKSVNPVKKKTSKLRIVKDDDSIEADLKNTIRKKPHDEKSYHQLMIYYRKQKEYEKELDLIESGIKEFEEFYSSALKTKATKRVTQISQSLLKSMGLADKKGKDLHPREPIGKWTRRKESLLKRFIKKKK